jgi:hypothetical protein
MVRAPRSSSGCFCVVSDDPGDSVDKASPPEHNVPPMTTLKERLPVAWSIFRKNAGTLLAATAPSHVLGLSLIFIFAIAIKSEALRLPSPDPGTPWDPTALWRSLGPFSKLSVFVVMFLNTTVPFAIGLSGVSYLVSCEHRGEVCDITELFPRMLKSSLLLIPMFLVLSFPWMIAHAFFSSPASSSGHSLGLCHAQWPSNRQDHGKL